jgi:hypothetical protein
MIHANYYDNGPSSKCICGAIWTRSDGGPCHVPCEYTGCGEIIETDGDSMISDSYYCPEHFRMVKSENDSD